MKRAIFCASLLLPGLLFLFNSCSSDETVTLESPEGKNAVVFVLKDGKPLYKVTPNFMSREWGRGYMPDNLVHSTVAKQLALMVVIYSPMQMAADLPELNPYH